MRTNLTSRARLTAGITVALTAGALAVAFSAPAGATETTTPDPETSTSASPDPSPSPSESTPADPKPEDPKPEDPKPEDPKPGEPETSPSPSPSDSPSPSTSPSPEEPEFKTVVVTGKVWRDKNRNGIQDAGEPGAPGVPVAAGALPAGPDFCALMNGNGQDPKAALKAESKKATKGLKASAEEENSGEGLTDAQGNYSFKFVTPGRYGVVVYPIELADGEEGDVTEDFSLTRPNAGDDAKDSDVKPCTVTDEGSDFTLGVYDATVTKDAKADVDAGVYNDSDEPVPAPGGGGSLPNTGLAITGFIVAGLALVGGGTALTILARRRRQVTA